LTSFTSDGQTVAVDKIGNGTVSFTTTTTKSEVVEYSFVVECSGGYYQAYYDNNFREEKGKLTTGRPIIEGAKWLYDQVIKYEPIETKLTITNPDGKKTTLVSYALKFSKVARYSLTTTKEAEASAKDFTNENIITYFQPVNSNPYAAVDLYRLNAVTEGDAALRPGNTYYMNPIDASFPSLFAAHDNRPVLKDIDKDYKTSLYNNIFVNPIYEGGQVKDAKFQDNNYAFGEVARNTFAVALSDVALYWPVEIRYVYQMYGTNITDASANGLTTIKIAGRDVVEWRDRVVKWRIKDTVNEDTLSGFSGGDTASFRGSYVGENYYVSSPFYGQSIYTGEAREDIGYAEVRKPGVTFDAFADYARGQYNTAVASANDGKKLYNVFMYRHAMMESDGEDDPGENAKIPEWRMMQEPPKEEGDASNTDQPGNAAGKVLNGRGVASPEPLYVGNMSEEFTAGGGNKDAVVNVSGGKSCVATGTMITLADGTQKAVEDLDGTEMLRVWNFETGTFDSAPILFIDHKGDSDGLFTVTKLNFEGGTTVEMIEEHGFWDYTLNKFVYLFTNNADKYIGHYFDKNGTKVKLLSVENETRITGAWSPVTFGHLNYYVNGLLSVPAETQPFANIFDVDPKTMRYDQTQLLKDIAKYGLMKYEDLADFVPEIFYYAFNGQYQKIAMGKGQSSYEQLMELVKRLGHFATP
jgi:hypothetical protein